LEDLEFGVMFVDTKLVERRLLGCFERAARGFYPLHVLCCSSA